MRKGKAHRVAAKTESESTSDFKLYIKGAQGSGNE